MQTKSYKKVVNKPEGLDINELSESYRIHYRTTFWLYLCNACFDRKALNRRIREAKADFEDAYRELAILSRGADFDYSYLYARALVLQDEIDLMTVYKKEMAKDDR